MDPRVEAISDEFESTFVSPSDGVLMNMFHENERPAVEALVKKHFGALRVSFTKMPEFNDDAYAGWIIRWRSA